uniref:Uncharacterized protein n=1 Tax=Anguilla anguilla TaxID=7936 RepID=A0A0E9UE89_ANGAN
MFNCASKASTLEKYNYTILIEFNVHLSSRNLTWVAINLMLAIKITTARSLANTCKVR